MTQEQSKVVFLLCDDQQDCRDTNKSLVERILRCKMAGEVPHEIHVFEDGRGPLNFLQDRGNAKGVILISDYEMPEMDGGELFATLARRRLLPAKTFLCSRMHAETFQLLIIEGLGICNAQKKIAFLPKGGGWPFAAQLPDAIQAAGREVGIHVAPRPLKSYPASQDKPQP